MEMNENFRRRGTGCPPGQAAAGDAIEPEVLPPMAREHSPTLMVGRVGFNRDTTLNSPCFWLLAGVGIGAIAVWYMTRDRR